ncbi:MAG: hypothetical protein IKM47_00410 [Bacteroidaceae bacterium]|jgi:hypothetical protein|nr:hypothetical protein [Bacteroidaceae bacterium]MBQ3122121.1 hypothetical protein [Bacteroidaceae bacterium]MBQ3152141.1 hypothetical protein [Bacteroidaceae bacterium]MBQ4039423.1 hypothetical protein [Bacteroidaceae bacterium]MBR4294635.1 hypothetical protein [Bacteroidaceae bacterium]
MKKVLNLLLAVTIVGLGYICYRSIMGPIEFEEERDFREKAIIARLIDIRTAQVEYRNILKIGYADNLDTLIEFVKTSQMPVILKEGELDDKQLERGLTEKKAMEIINKAKKTNNWKEVEKEGLMGFRRDTSWIALLDTIFPKGYAIDSLAYVPFGNGARFEVETSVDTTKAGGPQYLFEARTPYEVYLTGVNDQELKNLIADMKKMDRYCGLKVGDVNMPNNNAGNWE